MQFNQIETTDQKEKPPKEKILRVVQDGITALVFRKHARLPERERECLYFLFFPDSWITDCPKRIPANATGTYTVMHCLVAFYDVSDLRNHSQDKTIVWDGSFPVSLLKGMVPYQSEQYPCFGTISKDHLQTVVREFDPEAVRLIFPKGIA